MAFMGGILTRAKNYLRGGNPNLDPALQRKKPYMNDIKAASNPQISQPLPAATRPNIPLPAAPPQPQKEHTKTIINSDGTVDVQVGNNPAKKLTQDEYKAFTALQIVGAGGKVKRTGVETSNVQALTNELAQQRIRNAAVEGVDIAKTFTNPDDATNVQKVLQEMAQTSNQQFQSMGGALGTSPPNLTLKPNVAQDPNQTAAARIGYSLAAAPVTVGANMGKMFGISIGQRIGTQESNNYNDFVQTDKLMSELTKAPITDPHTAIMQWQVYEDHMFELEAQMKENAQTDANFWLKNGGQKYLQNMATWNALLAKNRALFEANVMRSQQAATAMGTPEEYGYAAPDTNPQQDNFIGL